MCELGPPDPGQPFTGVLTGLDIETVLVGRKKEGRGKMEKASAGMSDF